MVESNDKKESDQMPKPKYWLVVLVVLAIISMLVLFIQSGGLPSDFEPF